MTGRLHERFSALFTSLASRLRPAPRARRSRVKGCMSNVIVVRPPDPMFREAVFILRDDYFQSAALSRHELLRQAEEAARDYVASVVPPVRPIAPPLLVILPSAAVAVFVILCLTGIL